MNAVNFPERHQEQMMISEAYNFRQRFAVLSCRLNPANLAHRGQRTFRLDDKADELHDAPARLGDTRLTYAPGGVLQPI
jgi:hypothetical protein